MGVGFVLDAFFAAVVAWLRPGPNLGLVPNPPLLCWPRWPDSGQGSAPLAPSKVYLAYVVAGVGPGFGQGPYARVGSRSA